MAADLANLEAYLASLSDIIYPINIMSKVNEADIQELTLAIGLLLRRIRSTAPTEMRDFSWTQKAVMSRLDKDGPMTIADLARAEGVKPQSMGTAIATMEEQGLIERKPHPTDGRQFNIKLTAKGQTMRKSTNDARLLWLKEAIEKLDKQEQSTLFAASEIIKHIAES